MLLPSKAKSQLLRRHSTLTQRKSNKVREYVNWVEFLLHPVVSSSYPVIVPGAQG